MRDGIGIPALGQHRDRDHAADRLAKTVFTAYGVHHLAEQVLLGNALGGALVAGALNDLAPEPLDLVVGGCAEVGVQRVPAL